MNTPQVSIWVPVVVGLIGLVGIVVGQLINAWREDRRWKREQEREDLRWQREIKKDETAGAIADRAHWRDKKFEIYTEFLTFMKKWQEFSCDAATCLHRNGILTDESKGTCEELISSSFWFRDRIELIGTDRNAKVTLFDSISIYLHWTTLMSVDRSPFVTPGVTIDHFVDANSEVTDVILAAIRVDLGIGDGDDRDYLPRIKELALRE